MAFLDVARGAYVRSPSFVRRSLAPFLAMVPTGLRYGASYKKWRETVARGDSDQDFARAYHLEALRGLIQKAHAGSPFYRDLIDRHLGAGFDLSSITPEDLRALPVLTKEDLTAAGESVLAVPKASLDQSYTSGSNGEKPFGFWLDKDRSAREIAVVHHIWSRVGFGPDKAKAVLRGFRLPTLYGRVYEWNAPLKELRLSVFPMTRDDAALYLDLIDQRGIRYLYGYPSGIETFCRHMIRLGRRPKQQLLGILPISEPIYPHQRKLFAKVLGPVPIANFYGMSEKSMFAAEIPGEPDVYEFNPLYGVAELVDDAGQVITEPGHEGRLVGTGFMSTGMPFIRYDSCDRATLVEMATEANGYRLRVHNIMPRRKPDFLIGRDGERIVTIDFTPEDPVFFKGVAEYQFYQDTPGKVVIKYIPAPEDGEVEIDFVRENLYRKAEGRIDFCVEAVETLAAARSGKRAFIDQRLDISRF
jgi:phenylacetate-CoA ligase